MKIFSLFLLLILTTSCSQRSNELIFSSENTNTNIVGGQDVRKGDSRFISTVGILMVDDRTGKFTGVCTGTLIRSDIVLTAAHCVDSSHQKINLIVYFGDTLLDLSQFNSYRSAKLATVHEDYDLALIQVIGEIPPGFGTISLLDDEHFLDIGTELIVAGYGRNKSRGQGSGDGTGQLRNVKLKITDINSTELKSSNWSQSICMGDSGGPAYVKIKDQLYLAGITLRAYSIGPFNCIYRSTFLRVDKLQSWIEQKMQAL